MTETGPNSSPLNVRAMAPLAQKNLSAMAWAYYDSGADDEITLRENEAAWGRASLHYRVMADVENRSATTRVLGHELSCPIMTAPTAFHGLAHEAGELATATATHDAGTAMILSSLSTTNVEEVTACSNGPVFFQLYLYRDREVSRDLIHRVEEAGCKAIVLTVDAPMLGNRERDVHGQFSLPENLKICNLKADEPLSFSSRGGSGLAEFFQDHLDPGLKWEHLDWMRSITDLPIVLKGICRADDAKQAVTSGVDALVVSNHGGRQLDTSPATFDVLPRVCDAVEDECEVWVDGGIRRGTDVIKALAAGATATLIGRPILWGLGYNGQDGVAEVWSMMQRELDLGMALCGCRDVSQITRDLLSG
ncbi:MAG: alpha-hydroxy-acid oxidizing enzyme [Phycisphaerae bacterium]|nr:alpha-hydroxy-acid oxidizing enzyme [Phycisphaerae bacterium]